MSELLLFSTDLDSGKSSILQQLSPRHVSNCGKKLDLNSLELVNEMEIGTNKNIA